MELNHIPNSVEELIEKTSEMDVSSVISKLRGLGNQVIRKPHYKSKPLPPNEHTSESILNYSKELEEWEKYKEEKNKTLVLHKEFQIKVSDLLDEYIKEMSGLNDIPEKYRDKVYDRAWEDGHSDGYLQVYYELVDLVEIFN